VCTFNTILYMSMQRGQCCTLPLWTQCRERFYISPYSSQAARHFVLYHFRAKPRAALYFTIFQPTRSTALYFTIFETAGRAGFGKVLKYKMRAPEHMLKYKISGGQLGKMLKYKTVPSGGYPKTQACGQEGPKMPLGRLSKN